MREMRVDRISNVPRHKLLQTRSKLARQPNEKILEEHDHEDDQDHVPQRSHLVSRIQEHSDCPAQQSREAARREIYRRLVEECVEKRNEQRERERIEQGCADISGDRASHAPGMRPNERREPPVNHYLGVSSASGRMTSSGVTPPWRNDPRYLL